MSKDKKSQYIFVNGSRIKDLKGEKFGFLKVLEFDHIDKYAYWKCECTKCGNICVKSVKKIKIFLKKYKNSVDIKIKSYYNLSIIKKRR